MSGIISSAISIAFLLLAASSPVATSEILSGDTSEMILVDAQFVQPKEKIPRLERIYKRMRSKIDEAPLAHLSNLDVQNYYTGAEKLSFYLSNAHYASDLRSAFDELERRGLSTAANSNAVLSHYFAARMFDELELFAATHTSDSEFARITVVDSSSQPSGRILMRIGSDNHSISLINFSMPKGAHLIVVGSPWCSFSRAAGRAISKSPKLLELMKNHATWVMPQSVIPNLKDISRWNQEHPGLVMSIVFDQGQWASIDSWATPGFYFFRNGEVVSSVMGWESDAKVEELVLQFGRLGLQ